MLLKGGQVLWKFISWLTIAAVLLVIDSFGGNFQVILSFLTS